MLRLPRLGLALAAAALAVSGCSTGPTDDAGPAVGQSGAGAKGVDADAFPVTIKHTYGSTTIEKPPVRVATVSWVNADVALALDVVPVGMPLDEWGGNANQSTPWKDAALKAQGAAIGTENAPVQYSETDGIDFNAIAATDPDVILAAYSGLTKAEYTKLSGIAPVVAYPDVPYGTPWQESTRMIGKALGKSQQAEQLVRDTEQMIKEKAAEYPALAGKSFIYGNLEPDSGAGINMYTATDNRPRLLSALGMELAPVVANNTAGKDQFFVEWSPERANELAADVFVTWVPSDATRADIENDPLLGQIPAVENGALVADTSETLTLAISAASPLSLPWALDQFLPQLNAAAEAAEKSGS